MPDLSLSQIETEMRTYSALLDKALDECREQAKKAADAERTYRKAKSQAWIESVDLKMLAEAKKALVDAASSDERYERDLAEGLKVTAIEALRSHRAQLSCLQSLLNAHKSEAEFVRTYDGGNR